MRDYVVKTTWRRRVVLARDTLELRGHIRRIIGRRRSVRMRYVKIGANSFQVRSSRGRVVVEAWAA